MPDIHPTDRTLAALIDGRLADDEAASARDHIAGCPRCQFRVGRALPALDAARSGRSGMAEALLVTTVEEVRTDPPSPGDLWRLAWDDTALLVVVADAGDDGVEAWPLVDADIPDDEGVVLSPEQSTLSASTGVWIRMRAHFPGAVLDARVGRVLDLDVVWTASEASASDGSPGTAQPPLWSPLDERSDIEAVVETLATASWLPATIPEVTELGFDELIEAGLPPNRALALARGAAPSDAEADRIEALFGVRPTDPPVDMALARELDRPRWKPGVRRRALANRRAEAAERAAIAREVPPQLVAARGTRGEPPDYAAVLARVLDG